MAAKRFPIIFTQFGLIPVAATLLTVWAVWSERPWVRWPAAALAVATVVGGAVLYRLRPVLIVDNDGYAVIEKEKETLRVAWHEIKSLRADKAENALFADCGEPARNLLVPPKRGFGFRFERQAELYQLILDAVGAVDPKRIEYVEKLDNV